MSIEGYTTLICGGVIDSFDTVCIITVSATSLYLHRSLGSCAWVDIHRMGYRICVKVGARG